VSRRSKSSKTAPDSRRESSSDEEPDGILNFTPLQNEGMQEPQVSNLPVRQLVTYQQTIRFLTRRWLTLEMQLNSRSQQNHGRLGPDHPLPVQIQRNSAN